MKMDTIMVTVDDEAQKAWLPELQRFHRSVRLDVVETAGASRTVIKIWPEGATCLPFEGQASEFRLAIGRERSTGWLVHGGPTAALHIRVDARGQLEVWSGSAPLAKWFDEDAVPQDWPAGLVHATAGRVRDLPALLARGQDGALRSLSLGRASDLMDLSVVGGLASLESLNLSDCEELSDLASLESLPNLLSLNLSGCEKLSDLGALAGLTKLRSLDLSWSYENGSDLSPLAGLTQLQFLRLSGCKELSDLGPLAGLTQLLSLNLDGCTSLSDLGPLAGLTQLTSLDLTSCTSLTDLGPLAGLTQLQSLELECCDVLSDLGQLAGLTQLRKLNLCGCGKCSDLGSLASLTQIQSLNLNACVNLSDLGPLAGLTQLQSLYLSDCGKLSDLRPLAGLTQLHSLDLSSCGNLSDLGPLSNLTELQSLNLLGCERVTQVASLAQLSSLSTLYMEGCPNIRDADALSALPVISELEFEEAATRDSILLASAARRGDADLAVRAATAAASFELSKNPELHANQLVTAAEALVDREADNLAKVLAAVTAAFRARGDVPPKTWEALLAAVVRAPDPAFRPAFEAALLALPLAEAERVLAAALLALADAPASARGWALDLARQALVPVEASAGHARDVAPAAAVFFHAHGLEADVALWLERGTVAQVPAWRDRVLLALLGRALRAGTVLEARRLLGLMQTPQRRDEARALIVQHLAAKAEFCDAAAELDAIGDRTWRASAAARALAQKPAFAGEADAALSLLLALDGDPDTLADVLGAMVQHAPDSELVGQIAAVFAPAQGVDLCQAVDALLAHEAVTAHTKPKQLAALRARVRVDGGLAQGALARGAAALLAAEALVDADEAAELTAALLGEGA